MQRTIDRLSRELNIPSDVVIKVYKAYWMFIRNTIEELPLKSDISEQEYRKLKPNFNIPNLGKLTCTYDRYIGVKKRNRLISNKHAEHIEN